MLYDKFKTRRSIRKYKDQKIEIEKIDIILKSALLSPSSRSRRPWEFIAVTDKMLLSSLSKCREHGSGFVTDAPFCVVVTADPKKCDVWVEDASIAAIIIQLSAHALGLGSCWIQIRERQSAGQATASDYVKNVLSIPSHLEVECMIAIGYPDEHKQAYSDDDLAYEKLHYEKFM